MVSHIFETMGTVVTVEVPNAGVVAAVEAIFRRADARYSLYREDSELSRIATGRLALVDASDELRELYASCLDWRRLTDGAFTPHRPDGVIDLSGIVKAWAMDAAGTELRSAGFENWSLNAGGDILVAGRPEGLDHWTIGLVDPADRRKLLTAIALRTRRAVATSGSAERGEHIWRRGDNCERQFVQVSVAADDIITADILATAIVAGGEATLDAATERWDVDVLTVGEGGELRATPGMRAAMADAARN